jgi:1-acyl-sn-glycerol-3-phosphate acyltransferase
MAVFFSTLYWGFVGITSILFLPVSGIIWLFTRPFDKKLTLLHSWTSLWASLYTWMNPVWHVKVEGRSHGRRGARYVIVSNHQSMVDILVLFRIFKHFKWVSKSENFKIPFVGWNMRLNRYVEIERGSVKGSGRMMADCRKRLEEGSSVMIFPEGTRSEDGELRPFRRGAFELALQTSSPVLPIVIEGSSRALPKKGVALRGTHRIRVKMLEPVETGAFKTADELSDHVRSLIQTELTGMRAPA